MIIICFNTTKVTFLTFLTLIKKYILEKREEKIVESDHFLEIYVVTVLMTYWMIGMIRSLKSLFSSSKFRVDLVVLEFSTLELGFVLFIGNQSLLVVDTLGNGKRPEYMQRYQKGVRLGCLPPYFYSIWEGSMLSNICLSVFFFDIWIFSTVTGSRKADTSFQVK